MLNTLLDFFRLDSGKENANSAPFRLQGMADALLTEFIPLAEAKDLRFTVECCDDVILMGDKERIMQVCGNLLSNAVKFTQSGNVSFRMEYNGSVLSIVVEDTGNGMSGEEQQRVFGAFERLSNAATQDGFGLGLSIVKRIVDMLDGTIRLDSEKGKGSRFTIELPCKPLILLASKRRKCKSNIKSHTLNAHIRSLCWTTTTFFFRWQGICMLITASIARYATIRATLWKPYVQMTTTC